MRTNLERAVNGREIAALALVGPGRSIAERDFEAGARGRAHEPPAPRPAARPRLRRGARAVGAPPRRGGADAVGRGAR